MDEYPVLLTFVDALQVKIQKDSEVRLKIIGTRVDATEIVCYVSLLSITFSIFCPTC